MWKHFHRRGGTARRSYRTALAEHYLPLIKYAAERLAKRLPDEVDIMDLYQDGLAGLLAALEDFRAARGVRFETYAPLRIRGAILDAIRKRDWLPRLVRARSAKMGMAREKLRQRLRREPTDAEVRRHLQLDHPSFERLRRDSLGVSLLSLDHIAGEDDAGEPQPFLDFVADVRAEPPELAAQRREVRELIVRGLSPQHRLILLLYYYEELTMREIGVVLELSESRVSQLHSQILDFLRLRLSGRQAELEV